MKEIIRQYRQLRDEVDQLASKLSEVHSDHMACRKGCCGCCMNLSVWPVEFYSIVEEMKRFEWDKPTFNEKAACDFLKDGLCSIYPFRPIICRTHGLPLVYWHEETEPPGYGVMFCEKNFKGTDGIDFGSDNTLNMDEVNEKLARINLVFLDEQKYPSLESDTRIEMRKLLDYL
ncbi:MAG: YkgJ family cysteine cluster protein [Phycisphaerae bacterium]|nr:YkgJ family cysteine cluster protein [Phycisphaerae bacterium]